MDPASTAGLSSLFSTMKTSTVNPVPHIIMGPIAIGVGLHLALTVYRNWKNPTNPVGPKIAMMEEDRDRQNWRFRLLLALGIFIAILLTFIGALQVWFGFPLWISTW